jgi:type IV secretory pathway VirB2 component (pilin)
MPSPLSSQRRHSGGPQVTLPRFSGRPVNRLGATARTVAQRAPDTPTVVRSRAQPTAATIGRLATTAIVAYLLAVGFSALIGFTWWSLGITIVAGLSLGLRAAAWRPYPRGSDQRDADPLGGNRDSRREPDHRDVAGRGGRPAERAGFRPADGTASRRSHGRALRAYGSAPGEDGRRPAGRVGARAVSRLASRVACTALIA